MGVFDDLFDNPDTDGGEGEEGGTYPGCKAVNDSAKAILVKFPDRVAPHWVPRSQCVGACRRWKKGAEGTLEVTAWLVTKWEEEDFDPTKDAEGDTHSVPDVVCLRETDSAILCRIGKQEIWFPRSHVLGTSKVTGDGDVGTLVVSSWIAEQKGLVEGEDRPQRTRSAQDDLFDDNKPPSDGDDKLPF